MSIAASVLNIAGAANRPATKRFSPSPNEDSLKQAGFPSDRAGPGARGRNTGAATALATKLANAAIPADASATYRAYRSGYVSCGEKALSHLPRARIQAALEAPDVPAVWAALGSDALDRYVATCADVDLKRGPPPPH